MSAFLGHIHYWLYKKIQLVADRERQIFERFQEICGATAEELREQVWQTYGAPLPPDTDLAEVIDQSNIHGWLQRKINIAETREAAYIKELIDNCQGRAADTLTNVFYEHGAKCGSNAAQSYDVSNAAGIYKALQDYYLNGMPCDQNDQIIEQSGAVVAWKSGQCLQESNWTKAGVNVKLMTTLYQEWLKGFVQAANKKFIFRQTSDMAQGAPENRFEISGN